MILPVTEVRRITGYKQPAAQLRWLRKHGWKFTVNGLGEPVVAVAEFNRRLVGGHIKHQEPDYGALNHGPTT
jgi:hypothetical protein